MAGIAAHDVPKLGTSRQATLMVTNQDPLIGAFFERTRVVSIRIEGKPPNAKFIYYDAWFEPNEVATGTCK
jgi:hypothetical protein